MSENQGVPVQESELSFTLRKYTGLMGIFIGVVCAAWSIFQFYTSGFGLLSAMPQRATTLVFTLILTFLLYPMWKGEKSSFFAMTRDGIFVALAVITCVNIILNYHRIAENLGISNPRDIVLGAVLIVLVFEATRRTVGWPLVIAAGIFLIYAFAGQYMPGILQHRGYPLDRIIEQMYLGVEGIFGVPLGVMTTYVYAFLLFGSFLEVTGGAKLFLNLAYSMTGFLKGGPAKTAVIASALTGTISGSALANAVTTGTFTIPLMKSVGYRPAFAAGVEAATSTGGQLMPPIMGAAAFIMVELTGISYLNIIISAAIPSFLYYLSLYVMVHQEAERLGLRPIPKEELPKFRAAIIAAIPLIIPVIAIFSLLIYGITPLKSAFFATILLCFSSSISKDTRITGRKIVEALIKAARNAIAVSAAVTICGVIGGVVTLTGLGMKMSLIIIDLTKGDLFLTCLMVCISCLILGIGLPTTANYIVLAPIATPALIQLGLPVMTAHMFILYYGLLTEVTPPVALTAYTTAAIAGSPGMRSAIYGFKIAIAGFLIPFMFVYAPGLLCLGNFMDALQPLVTSIFGIVALGSSVTGYLLIRLNTVERVILFATAITLCDPHIITDLIGIMFFAGILAVQYVKKRRGSSNPWRGGSHAI
ncbi:MAG: TRAP transporter permease [Deltaproteobacteria bacterium]|nr:TRAP transporter permease [Deltaproteobacteria bacterium]